MAKPFLIFDLDDTLFDSEAAYAYSLKSIGIDPDSTEYQEARKMVKSRLGEGHVSARNRILYFKQMLDQRKQYSHSQVLDLMDKYETCLSEHIKNQWVMLGRKYLFQNRLKNIPKVIITNENLRTQVMKLNAIDPDGSLFPYVITSEEMGREKPHLALFQQAAEILGAEPKDGIMVGDSLENDIHPAIQLGMRAYLTTEFRNLGHHQDIPTEIQVINRLQDLERLFHE